MRPASRSGMITEFRKSYSWFHNLIYSALSQNAGGNVRPSSSGVNLGTAPGAIRPGSGLRPGSGMRSGTGMRIGTAGMGTRIGSVGSGVDVQITSRPMTQQGLGGMRAATAGPGRQIIDSSYLIGVIRAKSNEISSEISRMRSEMEKATRNSSLSLQLEKTYAALVKEVCKNRAREFNISPITPCVSH